MSGNDLIKMIIGGVTAMIIALILAVHLHNTNQINAVSEMTKNGIDPILAGCSIGTIDRYDHICSFYIGKNSQVQGEK